MMRRGFTLIEVLVAMVLIGLLSTAIGAFIMDLSTQRATLRDMAADRRCAGTLFDRLGEAVCSVVTIVGESDAGFAGSETELRIASRTIRPVGDRFADAQTSFFRLENERLVGGFTDAELISERVERLRLRYHDGEGWVDTFDSAEAGHLPVAFEVALWFRAPGANDTPQPSPEGFSDVPAEQPVVQRPPDRRRVFAIPGGGP
jgi:prepilin-type N-terminal cleavage/methylation domain-containing protein